MRWSELLPGDLYVYIRPNEVSCPTLVVSIKRNEETFSWLCLDMVECLTGLYEENSYNDTLITSKRWKVFRNGIQIN